MNLYFDQRNSDKVNVFVYLEGIFIGKIVANEKRVTGFKVPENTEKVRLSFSTIFDSTKKLPSLEINEEHFAHIKCVPQPFDGTAKQSWQFPYDIEFDATKYQEDLVFYPINFQEKSLKNCIYYEGRGIESNSFVELKLLKRVENFGIEKHRKKCLGICLIVFLISIIGLPYSLNQYISEYLPYQEQYDVLDPRFQQRIVGDILFSCGGLMGSIVVFKEKWKYSGMFNETEMKSELQLWSEVKK